MKCLVVILNKVELLDDLLAKLGENGIQGATILESSGMAHTLVESRENEATKIFGSLRYLLNPERAQSKTILCVVSDNQVLLARAAVHAVLGDLNQPDTGVLFTMPVDFFDGADL